MATADEDPIEIVIVPRNRRQEMETLLDTRWAYSMKWPRCRADEEDFQVAARMVQANSNFYGLPHLKAMRGFLEQIAGDDNAD